MALEDIFKALEEQASRDIEQITDDAHAHGQAIIDEAEAQAEALRASRVVDAERSAISQNTHGLNAARLSARKRQASVKERSIETVFDDALRDLQDARKAPEYPQVFARLAREAIEGVDGDFEILVDPADEQLASEVLGSLGKNATVRTDISTTGGLVVVSGNGMISRRNTFEDRLDKLRSIAQADVAEIVFA